MQNAAAEQTGEEPESAGLQPDEQVADGDASPAAPLGGDSPEKGVTMEEDKIFDAPGIIDDKEQVLKPEVL